MHASTGTRNMSTPCLMVVFPQAQAPPKVGAERGRGASGRAVQAEAQRRRPGAVYSVIEEVQV